MKEKGLRIDDKMQKRIQELCSKVPHTGVVDAVLKPSCEDEVYQIELDDTQTKLRSIIDGKLSNMRN